MAFALKAHEPAQHALRRLGGKQLGGAGRALTDADDPFAELHDVRKAAKRTRALLRVVRPGLRASDYREVNRAVRDAARPLSVGRDAQALIDTFDALIDTAVDGFV